MFVVGVWGEDRGLGTEPVFIDGEIGVGDADPADLIVGAVSVTNYEKFQRIKYSCSIVAN